MKLFISIIMFGAAVAASSEIIERTAEETARIEAVTKPTTDFTKAENFEALSAGAATNINVFTRDVFSQSSENMSFEKELDFKVGNGFFRKLWVSSPASTKSSDGLGPTFNARACQNCHFKDGRGKPNIEGDADISIFLRLSLEGKPSDPKSANIPHPVFGHQLQDRSIPGVPAEAKMVIDYDYIDVELVDGEIVELRQPKYSITDSSIGALGDDVRFSPRIAQQMIGLGLVESIAPEDILANEDPDDKNGDGISGRANLVWSGVNKKFMIGRFGHKAGNATVKDQSAGAFSGDMGLSTSLFPSGAGECTPAQEACLGAPDGADADGFEVSDEVLELVNFYASNLAVPKRQNVDDPQVLAGKKVFYEAGCASCHTPKFVTQRYADARPQSFQLIWPYSDFLLHDMGEGLADNAVEFAANGREWRTAPLWGIGYTELVTGEENYLHDGRARSLMEAILWHGGEAEAAKSKVVSLPKEDRDALVTFLKSL